MKKLGLIFLVVVLTGCGSSGGSGGGGAGTVGTNVFPKVAGTYGLTISEFSGSCTDGTLVTAPGLSLNIVVVQDNNKLTLTPEDPKKLIPGLTVLEGNDFEGLIESDGSFSLTRILVVTIAGIPGQQTVNYSMEGVFSDRDVFGDYTISMFFHDLVITCDSTATFTAPKL